MNLDLDRETIVEGIARGTAQFLAGTDAGCRFADLVETLAGLALARESLLTADQVARLLQISRRTFDRQVNEEKKWRKEETLGYGEPRFWLADILQRLQSGHRPAEADQPPIALRVVDLPGQTAVPPRRRGRPRQADKPAAA